MSHRYPRNRSAIVLLTCWLGLSLAPAPAHAQCGTTPAEILLTTGRRCTSADVLPSPDGSMYVVLAGVERDSLSIGMLTGRGSVLLRYGAGGQLEWAKHAWFQDSLRPGGWHSGDIFRYAIDSGGGVLVSSNAGRLVGEDTVYSWRSRWDLVRLRPDGQVSNVDSLPNPSGPSNLAPPVLEFAAMDNGVVGAWVSLCDVWRIDAGGEFTCVADPRLIDQQFHSVASDGDGGVLVAGEFLKWILDGDTLRTPADLYDGLGYPQPAYFVARWTLDGRLDWHFLRVVPDPHWRSHEYQLLATRGGIGSVLSFEDTTTLFVRGADTLETGPLTIAVFGHDGNFRWVRSFDYKSRGGSRIDVTYPDEVEFDLEIGAGGYVYASVPGRWARNGVLPLSDKDTLAVTAEDQILLVFDSTGQLRCGQVLPNAVGAGLGADRSGRVWLTGLMGEYTVLGGDTLRNTSWPRYSLFLTELEQPPTAVRDAIVVKTLRLAPNPARDRIYLFVPEQITGNFRVVITSVAGERVLSETLQKAPLGSPSLDVSTLPSGIYGITIDDGRSAFRSEVVIVR